MRGRSAVPIRDLKRERILDAVKLVRRGWSIRNAMDAVNFNVDSAVRSSVGSVHRALHPPVLPAARMGRPTNRSVEQEQKPSDAFKAFQLQGFNITKLHLIQAVSDIFSDMSAEEKAKWPTGGPSKSWMRRFCQRRHLQLRMENRIEIFLANATTTAKFAQHLSVLAHLVTTHNITAERVSNWDETGFSLSTMAVSRSTVSVDTKAGRSLSRGLSVGKDCEHITIGEAVAASGREYRPIFILPGKESKYRAFEGGSIQAPEQYLPTGAKAHYRDPAVVDGPIMISWVDSYLEETADLRKTGKKMVVFDSHASHLSLRVLLRLAQDNVILHALLAHTSHVTQPLNVSVFGPMKGSSKGLVSAYANNLANVGFNFTEITACELVTAGYNSAVTPSNIKLGFARTDVWPVNPAVFTDSTFSVSAPFTLTTDADAVDPWLDVHARFFLRGESLANSVTVTRTGTVCKAAGAHVTSAAVLEVLRQRADKRGEDAERKRIAAAAAAQKKTERAATTEANAARRAVAETRWTATASAAEEVGLRAVAGARASTRRHARPIR